jgi:hypothetical protein
MTTCVEEIYFKGTSTQAGFLLGSVCCLDVSIASAVPVMCPYDVSASAGVSGLDTKSTVKALVSRHSPSETYKVFFFFFAAKGTGWKQRRGPLTFCTTRTVRTVPVTWETIAQREVSVLIGNQLIALQICTTFNSSSIL